MKTILQLNTSILSGDGQSTRLAEELVASLRQEDTQVMVRDLARNPVPHLTSERFGAFLSKPEARTAEQEAVVRYSDLLISELKRADAIVLALPMYNFGVPSTLKAYIDHIARAGVTFKYTEKGPVGLLGGRKVYVVATRGGLYEGTALDTQTAYIRDFLAFLGITDVEFVYAEGLAMGDAPKAAGLAKARAQLQQLAPALA
jgi:FMN-dependent NADH-azoreductase